MREHGGGLSPIFVSVPKPAGAPVLSVFERRFGRRALPHDFIAIRGSTAKATPYDRSVTLRPNSLDHSPRDSTSESSGDAIESGFVGLGEKPGFPFDPSSLDRPNATPGDETEFDDLGAVFEEKFPLEVAVYDHARERARRWAPLDRRPSVTCDEGTEPCPKP